MSTSVRTTLLAICGLCVVHSATAQADSRDLAAQQAAIKLRPSYQKCLDDTGGVTPDMKDCMSAEFGFQDKRLNAAYKRLMSSMTPDEKSALRSDERDWIKHKDAQCASGPDAGQAEDLVAYDCVVNETAKRATYLEGRLPDQGCSLCVVRPM
jgi:uncharacterized protein YecT (DUF1311 family)